MSPRTSLALLGIWLTLGLVALVVFAGTALVLHPPVAIGMWLVALLAGALLGWSSHYQALIQRAHAGRAARWVTSALTPVLFACLSWANFYVMASWVHSALSHEERIEWTVRGVSENSPHRMEWTGCPYAVRFVEAGAYLGAVLCVSAQAVVSVQPGTRMTVPVWQSVVGASVASSN
jgi:hypothetical protein